MKKRPTLKGKGVDIFLGKENKTSKKVAALKKEKGTFYLPPSLVSNLDNVWLTLRRNNRKIRKSDIVKVALEQILKRFEEEGKESILFKHLAS